MALPASPPVDGGLLPSFAGLLEQAASSANPSRPVRDDTFSMSWQLSEAVKKGHPNGITRIQHRPISLGWGIAASCAVMSATAT